MYESFYGLKGKPFQLNADPSFYFGSRQHRRAMSFLEYGLHQNEGFIVITGEVGAGKTTLVRSLFENLDPQKVVAANLVSTQLGAEDTLRMVAAAFGVKTKDANNKAQLLLALEAFLTAIARKGKRCLLVVDEAQNLTTSAVEELRMLSNFQLDTHALLQSFLVGQPEFREMLESPDMLQLRQRVIAACHVGALDKDETKGYVEHRLRCAGWNGKMPSFTDEAFNAIHEATGGIPRRVNSICDRLLLSGFLSGLPEVVFDRTQVEEVAAEFNSETRAPRKGAAEMLAAKSLPHDGESPHDESQKHYLEADFRASQAAYPLTGARGFDSLEERLANIEQGLIRLETAILRVDRNNASSMSAFRGLIEWIRAQEAIRHDP